MGGSVLRAIPGVLLGGLILWLLLMGVRRMAFGTETRTEPIPAPTVDEAAQTMNKSQPV